MRKIFATILLSSLALLGCPKAGADVVSLEKAKAAARQYFNDGAVTRAGAVEPVLAWSYNQATKGPYAPAFYVFNNPQGGWMIISGEDSGRAILAWSDEGSFDPYNLPDNTEAWLEEYANQINWAREHNLKPSEASAKEWADLLEGHIRKAMPVKVLDNIATWGQGSPYNQVCPRIDGTSVSYTWGTRTKTGCVATATAIVMRHFCHPASGTGSIGGYGSYVKDISPSPSAPNVNLADHSYDWDNMPLAEPSSDIQKAAVAKLMFHIGLAVEMEYGTSASSSYQRKIQDALVNHFDYDPSMHMYSRVEFNQSSWLGLFKSELDENRPVIVAGRKSDGNGGHEFVATGYDSDDNIQINWGWDGSRNGYFALTYFKTTAVDASGSDYRYQQTLLIGIKPNENGPAAYSLGFYGNGFYLVSEPELDNPSNNFSVYANIYNRGGIAVPCTTRVYVCDYTGVSVGTSSTSTNITNLKPASNVSYSSWSCNLSNRTAPRLGDKLMVFYKNSAGNYTPITGQGSGYNNNIPIFDYPFIAVKDDGIYQVGDYFDFELINTRTPRSGITASWTFDGETVVFDEAYSQASRVLTDKGTHTIKAEVTIGGIKQTIVQQITVQ